MPLTYELVFPRKFPPGYNYYKGWESYSHYNYISGKFASFKRKHFENALKLAEPFLNKGKTVIDYGCADGFFIPTLSKHFGKVYGLDIDEKLIKYAKDVVSLNRIKNIELHCIQNLNQNEIQDLLGNERISAIFCLDVVEHIYEKSDPYKKRIEFIKNLLNLLDAEGYLFLSVPNMIGIPLFLQWVLSRVIGGVFDEGVNIKDLIRPILLKDTRKITGLIPGAHTGFNHKYLELYLKKHGLQIVKKKAIPFGIMEDLNYSMMYVLKK